MHAAGLCQRARRRFIFFMNPMKIVLFGKNVREFIYGLEQQTFAKTIRALVLLEANGHLLRMPHAKFIEHDLWELRIRSQQAVRLFYCIRFGRVYILSGFIKKTMLAPRQEIERAKTVRAELAPK